MSDQIQTPDTPTLPPTIRAFDEAGKEVQVPREEWAANVLPNMFQQAWDTPDHLYNLIINSLNDGFLTETAPAAEHLYQTDTIPARGACMWGIVLMQTGRLDEAEQVLTTHNQTHGEDASVLVNLAKLQATRGDIPQAEQTLIHALELEPNLDNGLGWYMAMQAEAATENPDAAARQALERIAAAPTSWRAQLWLARMELAASNLGNARALYAQALARAPRPLPPDFLMQLSGDLGGAGHLHDLIQYTAPEFNPELHGLPVGNNLIKAFIDTNQPDNARIVVDALQALNRPDWREPLTFWQSEINRLQSANPTPATPDQQQEIQIGMLRIDGPIWLPTQSPARSLFAPKSPDAPSVTFLGGTVELPEGSDETKAAAADAVSRMSRSLPLFLAEQVELRTAASGRSVLPWAVARAPGQPSGFVVGGARWPDADAVQMVADPANHTDYVVAVHLDAEVEPWTLDLAFLRTADGSRIGELSAEFPSADPVQPLIQLADEVIDLLASLGPQPANPAYQLPTADTFPLYLLRMEQLLALRCAGLQGANAPTTGQAEILQGDLELNQANPQSIPLRLLLIETIGAVAATNQEAAQQFQPTFQNLITTHPLPTLDAAVAQATTPTIT